MQWIEESEEKLRELERSYLEQYELLVGVKAEKSRVFKKEIGHVEFPEDSDPSVSYVAVDSAFKPARYLHADVYVAVAVAVSERGYAGDEAQMLIETKGVVEEDEERNRSYLEGLALSLEVALAWKLAPDYRMVFLDGSLHTFYTKFNNAFRTAQRAAREGIDTSIVRFLNENFQRISNCFLELLVRHPTVAVPKLRNYWEVEEIINQDELLQLTHGRRVDPYLILDVFLEPGEYIEIPPEELKTKAWTYPDEGPLGKKLQQAMQKRRVCYMKGINRQIFKFETTMFFDHLFLYVLTAGGKELLPLKVADEYAKSFLNEAIRKGTLWEEYR